MHKIEDFKRAAYHESGHALLLLLQQQPFEEVFIRPGSKNYTGCVNRAKIRAKSYLIESEILMLLAGAAAEGVLTGWINDNTARFDFREAALKIRSLYPGKVEHLSCENWMGLRAEHIVRRNWQCIEALAEELMNSHNLKYHKAREIFQKALFFENYTIPELKQGCILTWRISTA